MTPFFSVIIPVYNRAELLRRAIQSVLAQSCQDFEIVVVDDGSQDDPRSVVDSFHDPRIRFMSQPNGGGGKARNTAIDQARGRFVAPLDCDDMFLPHHLASMKTLLENTTGAVGYARIKVDRGGGRLFLKPPRALRPGEDMATYLLCDRGLFPPSRLWRRAMRRCAFAMTRICGRPRIPISPSGFFWTDIVFTCWRSPARYGGTAMTRRACPQELVMENWEPGWSACGRE